MAPTTTNKFINQTSGTQSGFETTQAEMLKQRAEGTVLYHCRQIAKTIDALQTEWEKLIEEEQKFDSGQDEGSTLAKIKIENEKLSVIDAVDEAIEAIQELLSYVSQEGDL